MALRHWLQLSLTEGIGPILSGRLIEAAGSAEAACAADGNLLRAVEGIGSSRSGKLQGALREAGSKVDEELDRCEKLGVTLLCPEDADYPPMLKLIPDPPTVLYLRGHFEARDLNAISIVGSRRCSYYGREQAERFGALLGRAGFTVISGGARGIDLAAHRGALSVEAGRTIAVLGSGADVAYPSENASLFDLISQRGVVVSEFPLGTPPLRENFPRRNRIVSGLSRGVLVVEADTQSGALITARQAGVEQGRPVFALPGRVDNPLSVGPHALIRDGATLVSNLEEIIEGLHPLPDLLDAPDVEIVSSKIATPSPATTTLGPALSERERAMLSAIGDETLHVDLIAERSGLAPEVVLQELTMMTLRGRLKRIEGQSYARSGR